MLDHVSELMANEAGVEGGRRRRWSGARDNWPCWEGGWRRTQIKRGRVFGREKERVEHRTDDKL